MTASKLFKWEKLILYFVYAFASSLKDEIMLYQSVTLFLYKAVRKQDAYSRWQYVNFKVGNFSFLFSKFFKAL